MPKLIAQRRNGNHVVDDGHAVCPGCGLTYATGREHRPDCTTEPSPLICAQPGCDALRLPSERGPLWQYQPNSNSYFCPDHHQKGTTT